MENIFAFTQKQKVCFIWERKKSKKWFAFDVRDNKNAK